MNGKIKALGLALAAISVFAAWSASAASAAEGDTWLTSDGPVTLIGEENGTESDFLEAGSLKVRCPGSTYTGHKYNVASHELIPTHARTITWTSHYNEANCKAAGLYPATVFTNTCDYTFHFEQTSGADKSALRTDIFCPLGSLIEVRVYTTAAEDSSTPFCTLSFGTQSSIGGLDYTDNTNGTGELSGTLTGLSMNRANHGAHTLLCPNGTGLSGSLQMNERITGLNAEGEATEVGLSTEPETTAHI